MAYDKNTYAVDDRPSTGVRRTLHFDMVADLTWAVSYRGNVIARYEQSVNGWDMGLYDTIHYRVTFPDGRVCDTREMHRKVVGWDTPSVLQRIWWDYNGYRPMASDDNPTN